MEYECWGSGHLAAISYKIVKRGVQIIKVNVQNLIRGAQALFPPSRAALQRYYLKGYKNTMLWLINNDLLERNPGSEV